MDASELDLDAKLYKASGTLLAELQHKLPLLLYRGGRAPRKCVLITKSTELSLLLDRFQEWPQLLDPCLANLVQLLTDTFLGYLTTSKDQYGPTRSRGTAGVSPLPRAICSLLYSLCKVRGYKVIVRLLNNEPKYLKLMLSTFRAWDVPGAGMTWEERYIMLLWLSHLLLAPFELATISVQDGRIRDAAVPGELGGLPGIAGQVISLALQHLGGAGKEREAASILLVRLSWRTDMQANGLSTRLVHYTSRELLSSSDMATLTPYQALGFLSLLYGITNSGSDSGVAPYLQALFDSTMKIALDQRNQFASIRDSAPARKWVLKILRAILTHALSLSLRNGANQPHQLNAMLEESIQYFLDALGDNDTPVRMAAAKALSVIALKLDPAMSAEVVEAVLGCLEENVLLEDTHTQRLVAITDTARADTTGMRRNISAVDPLRWHGLMLTLAHLLFRRSPPPDMLSEILQALILGLEFEQRSNVGTSLGVGVRDAACFGLWALARKYSTAELDMVSVASFPEVSRYEYSDCKSVLQLIAIKLVVSACFDPSGNIRRGASAALQELIGRHPDTIAHGIPVVQILDYHAVARLSRAMTEVAPQAAGLDVVYHGPLLQALTEWRGARAADVNQRRWAASALRILTKTSPLSKTSTFAEAILKRLSDLKAMNIGSTAAARHGLLLALSSILQSMRKGDTQFVTSWLGGDGRLTLDLKKLTGKIEGRTTADVELVMEGVGALVCEICKCSDSAGPPWVSIQGWTATAVEVLNHCTVVGTKDIVVRSSAEAFVELFKVLPPEAGMELIERWLDSKQQPPSAFASKGRMKVLSLIHGHPSARLASNETRKKILKYIIGIIEGVYKIETRVDAMEALGVILTNDFSEHAEVSVALSSVLQRGLTDYTNDQRGDIGSILRLQTLETVDAYRGNCSAHGENAAVLRQVMPLVVKLAAEKLNNVRFRAWKCLENYLQTDSSLPAIQGAFQFPADVSSAAYFQQLMRLLSVPWAHRHLILGFISSATSGSEDTCRAASTAFVSYMQSLEPLQVEGSIARVSAMILEELALRATEDDRQVLPFLDFLCFMIDEELFSTKLFGQSDNVDLGMWSSMQRLHSPSSTMQRMESLMNVYSRLLSIDIYRARALDKLTRQLLHRWPKVRNTAADLLYLDSPVETLASSDWNAPVAKNKAVVLSLRKQLGVVSRPDANGQ
ncbi:putative tubulin-specific chaperone D [Cladophialophora carrionii]|uniref:Putative tubulin-specific chaperone D n=1 Tax=Cladophialophora carrionii TaxID=86049 RepID=A0A1C1CA99_9EURO|nr:putative tubulin-specific chaperone D [Cladophialophora carrionii]